MVAHINMLISFQFQISMTLCSIICFKQKVQNWRSEFATGLMQIDSNFSEQLADWPDLSYVLRLPLCSLFVLNFKRLRVEVC